MTEKLPEPGDLIGVRYRIESLLGQGGMGAVYAAVNQATGRAVAIKWLLPGAARSQDSLARFLAEARSTAKIEHPNVITILDVGQDGESPFLVMERLRGESLAERLERGPLSPQETCMVMIAACRGVAEAHSEGVIHRDLKPDNIFLCQGKDGSPRPPKVLDFGISKLYDNEGGMSLTQTGIAMGTPHYMSPEQLNAPPTADPRFDVYAMGVVAYECLTGRVPYGADGLFELVQQIATGSPVPIGHLAPQAPGQLQAVVMRAMHVDNGQRFGSMGELILALEQVQGQLGTSALPAGVGYQMSAPGLSPAGPASTTGQVSAGGWTPTGGYGGATPNPASNPGATGPLRTAALDTGQYGHGAGQYGHGTSGLGTSGLGTSGLASPTAVAAPKSSNNRMLLLIGGAFVLFLGLGLGISALIGGFLLFGSGSDSSSDNPIARNGGGGGGWPTPGLPSNDDNPRTPQIDVNFTGSCAPRWNARLMVTGSADMVNVMSSSMGGLTGSIIMSLQGLSGTTELSTQQRMDQQTAINVMVGQRIWTNMAIDTSAVITGRIEDPIRGSVTVDHFDPNLAQADVTFHNLTLQDMRTGELCTLDGRVQTFGTTYGM